MIRLIRKLENREYLQEKFAVQQYADRLKRLYNADIKFFNNNKELVLLSLIKISSFA